MTDKYGRRGDGEPCQCDASYIHSVGQHRAHDRLRESTDLMDGGVTSALIEKEAEQDLRYVANHRGPTTKRLIDERNDARAMAALWKETARREFQYRVLARTGREFYRGVARKFEESRDAAVQERDRARGQASYWEAQFWEERMEHVALSNQEPQALIERAEKAEKERDYAKARVARVRKHWKECEEVLEEVKARAVKAEENVRSREEMINRLAARAEQAEQERDDALARVERIGNLHRTCHEQRDEAWAELEAAEQPRPFTADDITDEMVRRGSDWAIDNPMFGDEDMRELLTAALTKPPSRPEGAATLEVVLDAIWDEVEPGSDADSRKRLADALAREGVRALEEEQ